MKRLLLAFLLTVVGGAATFGQTTAFTYQGKLSNNSLPAGGNHDFEFRLFDAASGGAQQGTTQALSNVMVSNGVFTVQLDFGACPTCFNGAPRFLDISVRTSGGGAFVPLLQRQPLSSIPYALKSASATTATTADGLSAACVGCVGSSQIGAVNGSAVSGAIPLASVPAGSGNYIQNRTTTQANAFFDIGGSGHIGGGLRIEASGFFLPDTPSLSLSSSGIFQIDAPFLPSGRFVVKENGNVGIGNGAPTEKLQVAGNGLFSGSVDAGTHYRIGGRPVFTVNGPYDNGGVTAISNTFAGDSAGINTAPDASPTASLGKRNAFFGSEAGKANTNGSCNTFFGSGAGKANTSGSCNAFFGDSAGQSNTASFNTFLGSSAGFSTTTGSNNLFVGPGAGYYNTSGSGNTFVGSGTNFEIPNPTGNNNTLLGSNAGVVSGLINSTAIGANAYASQSNSLVLGSIAGYRGATADTRVAIGITAPSYKLHIMDQADKALRVQSNIAGGILASFGDKGAFQVDSSTLIGGRLTITESGNVGVGTDTPNDRLHVNGGLRVTGTVKIQSMGGTGTQHLCWNTSTAEIANCSSSIRYKNNVVEFQPGLSLINRLRPVTYNWIHSGEADLGLIAEEVAGVEPLLVTRDDKGRIEGVKYDRLSVAFINAFKEQQAQLEQQRRQSEALQRENGRLEIQVEALRQLVCLDHAAAAVCK